jgi:hypothetical protein
MLALTMSCIGSSDEAELYDEGEEVSELTQALSVPANMAPWCSLRTLSGSRWAFSWGSASSDPCASGLTSSPGAVIRSAGLYSTNATNKVLVQCDGAVIRTFTASGSAALRQAHDDAVARGFVDCRFVVAPGALPIFDAPFPNDAASRARYHVLHATGVDQARTPLDVREFGQTPVATGNAALVDHLGRDQRNSGGVDNHDGHDWPMDTGTPILAVADGEVIASRARNVTSFGCGADAQQEIYLLHKVGSGTYREWFVTYYAHLSRRDTIAGRMVRRGQRIGLSGDTGCSSGPHLHFGTTRLTNTTGAYRYDFAVTSGAAGMQGQHGDNAFAGRIDPYGWAAPQGVDPLAHRFLNLTDDYATPIGAWSINLWRSLSATPPNPNW